MCQNRPRIGPMLLSSIRPVLARFRYTITFSGKQPYFVMQDSGPSCHHSPTLARHRTSPLESGRISPQSQRYNLSHLEASPLYQFDSPSWWPQAPQGCTTGLCRETARYAWLEHRRHTYDGPGGSFIWSPHETICLLLHMKFVWTS